MNLQDIVLYAGLSGVAAAINAVAGGGTFLVFPVLILSGLSPVQANIACTMALWPGSLASATAYRGELGRDASELAGFRRFLGAAVPVSMAGSALGTALLLLTPERTFSALVPWLLLSATLIFTFGRRALAQLNLFSPGGSGGRRRAAFALQFAIAVYGGYFGAGIGILMLAMLQLMGFSRIHQMNALKTVLGSAINAVAWAVFALSGRVLWPVALVMIAGAVMGGYFGARLALKVPPEKIRAGIGVLGFAMSAYFFLYGA